MISLKIPIKVQSPNTMEHWRQRATRNKKHAALIKLQLSTAQEAKSTIDFPCVVTLTRLAPRLFDEDNLIFSMKSYRDTVADYLIPGLKPGRADGDKRITWIYKQQKGAPKEYALLIDIDC